MRRLLLTGAALALSTGLAAAQTTGQSSQSGTSQNKNAPAMQSSTETMPPQRQTTIKKTMDKSHPKPDSGSSSMQHSGSSD